MTDSAPASQPLLQVEQVGKAYTSPSGETLTVLDGLDLTLSAGESVGIVGPSGSGKSTLLNLIGGLDEPTSGRVLIEGTDVASLGEIARADLRARRVGFIFQAHHLLPQCTVLENVLLPTLALDAPPPLAERTERAKLLLERVGLAPRIGHRPGQLSGGECQRVAVARALINGPALLLADEPTGALDKATSDKVADLLVELNREQSLALVVVTHAPDLAARMGAQLDLGALAVA